MEKDNLKLKWDYFEFNHIYNQTEEIRAEYNKIFKAAHVEISKFEKKHNVEIFVFFTHGVNELSLYSCVPDNYDTKEKSHLFLDELNHYLKEELKYPLTA